MVGEAIHGNNSMITNDNHGINSNNNIKNLTSAERSRHSYFLRAKQPRYVSYESADHQEDNSRLERKKLSSLGKVVMDYNKDGIRPFEYLDHDDEDLADCFVVLPNKSRNAYGCDGETKGKEVADKGTVLFQCKACKKEFSSHQALGGHRASHKKVKGCYAAKIDDEQNDEEEDEDLESFSSESDIEPENCERAKLKMHECSVCRRVFSSGQALGGHKRCHWFTNSSDNSSFVPSFHDIHFEQRHHLHYETPRLNLRLDRCLDLNLKLTAPQLDDQESTRLYVKQLNEKNEARETEAKEKIECEKPMRNLTDLMNPHEGWLQVGISSTADLQ